MSQPYVGEIRLVPYNFAPVGWAFCNGALIAIDQNPTLYQLIGTTYGGDGQTTFALPNLQGRVAIHQGTVQGTPFVIGQLAGTTSETLTANQIPNHRHLLNTAGTPASTTPGAEFPAKVGRKIYGASDGTSFLGATISSVGGSQPHDNMQPFLVLNYIISMFGIFPSQT